VGLGAQELRLQLQVRQ
jgi:hypothetical protein